ncbi:MAG: DUF523 domain-containing protein [Gammaproteobacteria bacterium]|nr:DUF523 domain-containing protein [Gammaproteobacteria bacterium]
MTHTKHDLHHRRKPRVGISSCLLGHYVRYDGKDKRNDFIVSRLSEYVEFIAICPEVGIGLGVPRAPIHLIDDPDTPEKPGAVFIHDPCIDVTQSLATYAKQIAQNYPDLSGFIFKSRSPSCGLYNTPVFSSTTTQHIKNSSGIFASEITRLLPRLPTENEENLLETNNIENFIHDVTRYHSKIPFI